MQETLFIRFHEVILIIYVLSLLCYFWDFVRKTHKVRTFGNYTLGIVWMLQTISLSVYITSQHEVPLGSIFDVFLFGLDINHNFINIKFNKEYEFLSIFLEFNRISAVNNEYIPT